MTTVATAGTIRYIIDESVSSAWLKGLHMHQPFRAILVSGLGAAVLLCLGSLPLSAQGVPCVIKVRSGVELCYSPVHLPGAEQQMSARVVSPIAAVFQATHLTLSQVIDMAPTRTGISGITYVFGRIPGPVPNQPSATSRATPKFVLVQEVIGHVVPSRLTVTRVKRSSPSYGPWLATAIVPHRNLSLLVSGNETRAQVRQIVQGILAHARTGR